jgi:hypothetical protein
MRTILLSAKNVILNSHFVIKRKINLKNFETFETLHSIIINKGRNKMNFDGIFDDYNYIMYERLKLEELERERANFIMTKRMLTQHEKNQDKKDNEFMYSVVVGMKKFLESPFKKAEYNYEVQKVN